MNLVEAINIVIKFGAGVRPVSTEDEAPPGVIGDLERVRKRVMKSGSPFAVEQMDLLRNSANQIVLQPDVFGAMLPNPYIIREGKIYNRKDRTYVLDRDFADTSVIMDVPFAKLQESIAELIAWETARDYAAERRGADSPRYAFCEDRRSEAEVRLSQDFPALTGQNNPDSGYVDPFFAPTVGSCGLQWCFCR